MSSNKRPPDGSFSSPQREKRMRDGYSRSPTTSVSESHFPNLDEVATLDDSFIPHDYAIEEDSGMIAQQISMLPNDMLHKVEMLEDYNGAVDQTGCRIYHFTDSMPTETQFATNFILYFKDDDSQYKISLSLDNFNSRPCYNDGERWIEDTVAPSSKTFQQHIQLGQKTGIEWTENSVPIHETFITFIKTEDPNYFRISEKVKYFFRLKVENIATGVYVYVHHPVPFLATYSPAWGPTRMYGPIPVFSDEYCKQLRLIPPKIREVFKWSSVFDLKIFYEKKLREHAIGYPSYFELEFLAMTTGDAPDAIAYWFAFQNGHELSNCDHLKIIKSLMDTDVLKFNKSFIYFAYERIQSAILTRNELSGEGLLNISAMDFTDRCDELMTYYVNGATDGNQYKTKLKNLSQISNYSERDIFLYIKTLKITCRQLMLTVKNYRSNKLEAATREDLARFCDDYRIGKEYIDWLNRAVIDYKTRPIKRMGLCPSRRRTLLEIFNRSHNGFISFYEDTIHLNIITEQILLFYQEKNKRRIRKDMIDKQMKDESLFSEDPFGVWHSKELLNYGKIPLGQPLYDCQLFQLNLAHCTRWRDDGSGLLTIPITERTPTVIDNKWMYRVRFADKESTFRIRMILNASHGRANIFFNNKWTPELHSYSPSHKLVVSLGEHTGHYWQENNINLTHVKMCLQSISCEATDCFHVFGNIIYTPTIEIQNIHTGKLLNLSHSTDVIFESPTELELQINGDSVHPRSGIVLKEFFNKKVNEADFYTWDGRVSPFELDQLQLMIGESNHDRILSWLRNCKIRPDIDCKRGNYGSDLVTCFRWEDRSKRELLENVDHEFQLPEEILYKKQLDQVFSQLKNSKYNSQPEITRFCMDYNIGEAEMQVYLRRREIRDRLLSEEKFLLNTVNWTDRERAIQHVCDVLTLKKTVARRWFIDHDFQTRLDNTPIEERDQLVRTEYRNAMEDRTLRQQLDWVCNIFFKMPEHNRDEILERVKNYDLNTYIIMEKLRVLNNNRNNHNDDDYRS